MNTKRMTVILLFAALLPVTSVVANPPAIVIREVAEYLMKKSSGLAAKGAQAVTSQVTDVVTKYGPDALPFLRKAGPDGLQILDSAGANAPDVIKLVLKRGDEAVYVISKPRNLAIFVKHGDNAIDALAKHPGLAEDLIERFGSSGATAMTKVSRVNAQHLAILAKKDPVMAAGQADQLLKIVGKYGDNAAEFIWKNKVVLASSAVLAAFLADPEPYLNGTKDLASAVVKAATPVVASWGNSIAQSTLPIFVVSLVALYFVGPRLLKQMRRHFASSK
jgi:hypothetical protein